MLQKLSYMQSTDADPGVNSATHSAPASLLPAPFGSSLCLQERGKQLASLPTTLGHQNCSCSDL